MSEGMTCYEQDERLCEDQMCLRVGCKISNEKNAKAMSDDSRRDEIARAPEGSTHMRRPEYLTAWLFDGKATMPIWLIERFKSRPLPYERMGHYATAVDGEFWRWVDPAKFDELFLALPATNPITTEQLDQIQFGRSLHERPATNPGAETMVALASSLVVAWDKYVHLFGGPPHGTGKQMRALMKLMPDYAAPALSEVRIAELERQLAESDALIAVHANKIDCNPRSSWPKQSILAAAIDRNAARAALTQQNSGGPKGDEAVPRPERGTP